MGRIERGGYRAIEEQLSAGWEMDHPFRAKIVNFLSAITKPLDKALDRVRPDGFEG